MSAERTVVPDAGCSERLWNDHSPKTCGFAAATHSREANVDERLADDFGKNLAHSPTTIGRRR